MAGWLVPVAMAAGDILGSWWAGKKGEEGQERANEQNVALAREQMAFQREMAGSAERFSEKMSDTAIQRRVRDLIAAGLNPALAYGAGGASSPAGVAGAGASTRVENTVSSGMAAKAMHQQLAQVTANIQNQTQLTSAEVKNKAAQTEVAEATRKQIEQTTDFQRATQPHQLRALELQNMVTQLGITGLENEQELEDKLSKLPGGSTKTLLSIIRSFIRPR